MADDIRIPKLQVEIVREIDIHNLAWPSSSQAASGLGGNKEYLDFRSVSWEDAHRILTFEDELVNRIENSGDPPTTYEEILDEIYDDDEGLLGLDIGVAGVVLSLSVAKCIPFTSCNGGFYGGHHREHYPLVGFYARRRVVPILMKAATEADIGITSDGEVFAYRDKIVNMLAFARLLLNTC